MFKKITATLTGLLIASQSFAWGDLGHAVVGEIAQRNLSPKGKALVYSLIGAEPLGVTATWPDLVRSDSRFAPFANFHFLEIQPGRNFETRDKAERDGNTIVEKVPALLLSKKLSVAQKSILLRYLVHLVGDLHQPLHVGNGQDRGANLCTVKIKNPSGSNVDTNNLHSVWDVTLVDYLKNESRGGPDSPSAGKKYFDYQDLVNYLDKQVAEGKIAFDKDAELKMSAPAWYLETQSFHSVVYPDDKPVEDVRTREYCKVVAPDPKDPTRQIVVDGNFRESSVPTLKDEYIAKALPVIKRQLVLGGLRLAKIINEIADKSPGLKPWTEASEKAYFDGILLKNDERGPSSSKKKLVDTDLSCEH